MRFGLEPQGTSHWMKIKRGVDLLLGISRFLEPTARRHLCIEIITTHFWTVASC